MSDAPQTPPPSSDELAFVPRGARRRKKGVNLGAVILGVIAIVTVGGGLAVLKWGAKVVPADAIPGGVPSVAEAERCRRNGNILCAEANYIAYLKKYPDDLRANAVLAIVMTQDGRHHESLRYYDKAIDLGGSTYDLHANHARSLEATGDLDGAIGANYAALELVPSLVDVRGALAEQLVRKGKADEALNLLKTFDRSLEDRGHPPYFTAQIDRITRRAGGAGAQQAAVAAGAAAASHLAPTDRPAQKGVTLAPLKRGPGVLLASVTLNGVVEADFAVDSGASEVVLTEDVYRQLVRSHTLGRGDFLGSGYAELADGSRVAAKLYNLRSLKVGGRELHNVTALVPEGGRGQLLLGQSFLRRFKSWSIDNHRGVLELRD